MIAPKRTTIVIMCRIVEQEIIKSPSLFSYISNGKEFSNVGKSKMITGKENNIRNIRSNVLNFNIKKFMEGSEVKKIKMELLFIFSKPKVAKPKKN